MIESPLSQRGIGGAPASLDSDMSEHKASIRRALLAFPACMGGWCIKRDACALHLTQPREQVVERLCQRGQENPVAVL